MRIAGAVLAGGQSRRMGQTKALIDIDGVPMAARVAASLTAAGCLDVVLVGGDPTELATLGFPVIADLYPRQGPVGGVLTALGHHGDATHVVVAACDLPALSSDAVKRLLDVAAVSADVVVARTDRLQPVLAVWAVRSAERIAAAFGEGARAMHEVLDLFDIVTVAIDPAEMRNVNKPEDLTGRSRCDDEGGQ